MPLRDQSLTVLPRFSVTRRKPSHLVSKTHFLSSKGLSTSVASIGRYAGFMLLCSALTGCGTLLMRGTQNNLPVRRFAVSPPR